MTCIISGTVVTDARIYVYNSNEYNISAFICQNNRFGSQSPDKLGYNGSWQFAIHKFDWSMTQGVSNLRKVSFDIFEGIVELSFSKG